jgi:hypothetical protein
LTTQQVHELLHSDPPPVADIAVVLTGVNDVINLVPVPRAVAHRAALAEWLLDHGRARAVLFAPLPPINQFPLLPQPLRLVMGQDARRHDEAMAQWAGGQRDVFHCPLALQLAPVYRACGEQLARYVAEKILPLESRR